MRVKFWQPAGEYERFAAHAFDSFVGQEVPFKIKGIERGQATVVAVEVAEDGTGANWTLDILHDRDLAENQTQNNRGELAALETWRESGRRNLAEWAAWVAARFGKTESP
jgi:hypothetical protein